MRRRSAIAAGLCVMLLGGFHSFSRVASGQGAGGWTVLFDGRSLDAIRAEGPRMIVTLNGTRTVDVEHRKLARGPIALQYGAGTVKFRNVQIRKL